MILIDMPKNLHEGDEDLELMDIKGIDDVVDNEDEDEYNDNDDDYSKNKNKGKSRTISSSNRAKKTKQESEENHDKDKKLNKTKDEDDSSYDGPINVLNTEDKDDSKFFVVRVSGGQENLIASMLQSKLSSKKIEGIYSILFLENFKGYVIVEALDSNIAYEALHGIRHIRGQIRGELPFKDLEGYLIKKPVVTELTIDDTVEIIAGPFKSMKAKIMRVDYEKQEATVVLLDSPYQIPVTVDANYLKKAL